MDPARAQAFAGRHGAERRLQRAIDLAPLRITSYFWEAAAAIPLAADGQSGHRQRLYPATLDCRAACGRAGRLVFHQPAAAKVCQGGTTAGSKVSTRKDGRSGRWLLLRVRARHRNAKRWRDGVAGFGLSPGRTDPIAPPTAPHGRGRSLNLAQIYHATVSLFSVHLQRSPHPLRRDLRRDVVKAMTVLVVHCPAAGGIYDGIAASAVGELREFAYTRHAP